MPGIGQTIALIKALGPDLKSEIADKTEDWLDDHITQGLAVDDTLSIQGAAADAKKVGDTLSAYSSLTQLSDGSYKLTLGS